MKNSTMKMKASDEDRQRIQGIVDNNGGGISLITGPMDWQQQQSVDFPWYRVADSDTV